MHNTHYRISATFSSYIRLTNVNLL